MDNGQKGDRGEMGTSGQGHGSHTAPPDGLTGAYLPADTPLLDDKIESAQKRVAEFNRLSGSDPEGALAALKALIGSVGRNVHVRGPLSCDLGENISIGEGTFINSGLTALDIAPIKIGECCNIGPNVSLLTPIHPVDPGARLAGWEGAAPVTICDNVWIGGGATILPGVTVGDGAVIGAGSVVSRNVAASQLAVGNPARVIRSAGQPRRPTMLTALITCPVEKADEIAEALVEARNAACVNVIDSVRSVYRWQGAVTRDREALLVAKTSRSRVAALEAQLTEIHPHEVHELICLPVEAGSKPYLDWLADSLT